MALLEIDKKSPTYDLDFEIEYNKIFDNIKNAESILYNKLKAVVSGAPINIVVDIKDFETAKQKFKRPGKKYKKITDMPDLLRSRIILPINYNIESVKQRMKKQFRDIVFEDVKITDSGYSAVHAGTVIDGIRVEIQIIFRNSVAYLDLSHRLYEKTRENMPVDNYELNRVRNLLETRDIARQKALENLKIKYKKDYEDQMVRDLLSESSKFHSLLKVADIYYKLCKLASSLSDLNEDKFKFIVLQKPLAAGKEDEIESFIRDCGATILNKRKVLIDSRLIGLHYKQFVDKNFFMPLIKYYVGKFVYIWLVEGNAEVQKKMRNVIGSPKVDVGSFRHILVGDDYKEVLKNHKVLDNGIHVSDSPEEGYREAKVWFGAPELVLNYSDKINDEVTAVHKFLWKKLNSIPYAFIQYSNTNNETAVISKPVDIDYRVLVPKEKIDEAVDYIVNNIPGAFLDRLGKDERTGSEYKKLEYVFNSGKADIAVVDIEAYKDRIGSGHLTNLLPVEDKIDIGKRKEEAWNKGKDEYKKVKEQIQKEIKERFRI